MGGPVRTFVMLIGSTFRQIAEGWAAFHALGHDDKNHPVRRLVTETAPANSSELKVEGSVGKGILTAAPWVAVFHPSLTTTAQEEYYVVYLFSLDMQRVVLELGLGAAQFERAFRTNKRALAPIRAAADRMERFAEPHLQAMSGSLTRRIRRGPANLGAERARAIATLHTSKDR
jgi:MrcB-like, N-terminal domain